MSKSAPALGTSTAFIFATLSFLSLAIVVLVSVTDGNIDRPLYSISPTLLVPPVSRQGSRKLRNSDISPSEATRIIGGPRRVIMSNSLSLFFVLFLCASCIPAQSPAPEGGAIPIVLQKNDGDLR